MSYSNRYLRDFASIFKQILKQKNIPMEKLHLEIIDESTEKQGIFEPVGVDEVLEQLAEELNNLTIYTNRREHFEPFAKNHYYENGLMTVFFSKKEGRRKSFLWHHGVSDASKTLTEKQKTVVLDFEWEEPCYFSISTQGKYYIPIYKKPWEMAENLDIIVPFGYNTVIVKNKQKRDNKPVQDRFEEAFYSE